MCDLVDDETQGLGNRFLEPTCDMGSFLAENLERKLKALQSNYSKSIEEQDLFSDMIMGNIH